MNAIGGTSSSSAETKQSSNDHASTNGNMISTSDEAMKLENTTTAPQVGSSDALIVESKQTNGDSVMIEENGDVGTEQLQEVKTEPPSNLHVVNGKTIIAFICVFGIFIQVIFFAL
jgi:hypothetical protein